jgi:hypothetical protein
LLHLQAHEIGMIAAAFLMFFAAGAFYVGAFFAARSRPVPALRSALAFFVLEMAVELLAVLPYPGAMIQALLAITIGSVVLSRGIEAARGAASLQASGALAPDAADPRNG